MLQVEPLFIFKGILNLEGAVLLPGNKSDAILPDVTKSTIWPLDLRAIDMVMYKNIFLMPPHS